MNTVLVLDTNIVLDLLVFEDSSTARLLQGLESGVLDWPATLAMREEFWRVLAYPHIAPWLQSRGKTPEGLLGEFDRLSRLARDPAPQAPGSVRCSDPDDQRFIDLALAHKAFLLSKDLAVLRLRKRLALLGVMVQNAWAPA